MSAFENPALAAFVARLGGERVVAQVRVRREATGFEVRHADDRDTPAEALERVSAWNARDLAQAAVGGDFRPLKSAPTLRRGWRILVRDAGELGVALDRLYPGAVADWFASTAADVPVTNWTEFTARQSGMYRITTLLGGPSLAALVAETCAPARCLKRRLWCAPSAPADGDAGKSLIPCLEPCALMLEAARARVRVEQDSARG
ncbi:MAG: hypothetical protein FJ386_06725 [Verrucomicrobia bacterium]|nr:hypothetical protein [Verrucomicrobiota bacterium]